MLRRLAAVIAEIRYAQRRVAMLAAAPDRHIPNPHTAPGTYAEFLFRTCGPLLHEPSAASRARGQLVRLPARHAPDPAAQGPPGSQRRF